MCWFVWFQPAAAGHHKTTSRGNPMKSILITGCSSGIGLDAALAFRDAGWLVLEGHRKTGIVHCSLLLFRTPSFLRVALGGTNLDGQIHIDRDSLFVQDFPVCEDPAEHHDAFGDPLFDFLVNFVPTMYANLPTRDYYYSKKASRKCRFACSGLYALRQCADRALAWLLAAPPCDGVVLYSDSVSREQRVVSYAVYAVRAASFSDGRNRALRACNRNFWFPTTWGGSFDASRPVLSDPRGVF